MMYIPVKKFLLCGMAVTFISGTLFPVERVQANNSVYLPTPGEMVPLSQPYQPALIKGLTIHADNPFLFDFIIDKGAEGQQSSEVFKVQANRMIRYFFASLTIPDKDIWVNLSPYEKDRIVPTNLGKTEMGRDLLAQDYLLKQLTSSLLYPEKELGKKFWDNVYTKAQHLYGHDVEIPINVINKVWIVADTAHVYEHGQTAWVVDSHLKVMLEEDYVAMQKNSTVIDQRQKTIDQKEKNIKTYRQPGDMLQSEQQSVHPHAGYFQRSSPSRLPSHLGLNRQAPQGNSQSTHQPSSLKVNQPNETTNSIIKQIIIPEIEREVNSGKNFASLRQIFNSLILATWFKRNLKQALLNKVYADKSIVKGIDRNASSTNKKIYEQYLKAYQKGVFNYIKEEPSSNSGRSTTRKYFSGGFSNAVKILPANAAMLNETETPPENTVNVRAFLDPSNSPMTTGDENLGPKIVRSKLFDNILREDLAKIDELGRPFQFTGKMAEILAQQMMGKNVVATALLESLNLDFNNLLELLHGTFSKAYGEVETYYGVTEDAPLEGRIILRRPSPNNNEFNVKITLGEFGFIHLLRKCLELNAQRLLQAIKNDEYKWGVIFIDSPVVYQIGQISRNKEVIVYTANNKQYIISLVIDQKGQLKGLLIDGQSEWGDISSSGELVFWNDIVILVNKKTLELKAIRLNGHLEDISTRIIAEALLRPVHSVVYSVKLSEKGRLLLLGSSKEELVIVDLPAIRANVIRESLAMAAKVPTKRNLRNNLGEVTEEQVNRVVKRLVELNKKNPNILHQLLYMASVPNPGIPEYQIALDLGGIDFTEVTLKARLRRKASQFFVKFMAKDPLFKQNGGPKKFNKIWIWEFDDNVANIIKAVVGHAQGRIILMPAFEESGDQVASPPASREASKAQLVNLGKSPEGGINLENVDEGMKVVKDTKGQVNMSVDQALIERIKSDGLTSANPVIISITPVTTLDRRERLGL